MKIHIFGASGSGTTTLGKILGQKLGWVHLDADDYYWKRTNPPFQTKIPLPIRNARITQDINAADAAIISGSMVSWGPQWEKAFDLAVFLYIPPQIRMERLRQREIERYGDKIEQNPERKAQSDAFFNWAAQYDDPDFRGRSLTVHEEWITRLTFPVLRIEGDTTVEERVNRVIREIESMNLP